MNSPAPALAALLLVGLLSGCGGDVRASDPGPAPEASTPAAPTSTTEAPPVTACGEEVAFDGGSGLRVTGHLPARIPAPGTPTADLRPAAGTVEVSGEVRGEVAGGRLVRGVTSPAAEVTITRDGRVVALPPAQDAIGVRLALRPGSARTLDAPLSLVSCADATPLPAGRYEVWARVAVTADDGTTVDGVGGPWPLVLTEVTR